VAEKVRMRGGKERRKSETRIWLQILSLESIVFSRLNSALNADFGLSVAKFEFLAQIDRQPDGISLGAISANLKVTSGNVSGLVSRLLADKLIAKEISREDRRSFIVTFTAKGKALFDRANDLHARTLAECFADVPTPLLQGSLTTLRSLSSTMTRSRRGR